MSASLSTFEKLSHCHVSVATPFDGMGSGTYLLLEISKSANIMKTHPKSGFILKTVGSEMFLQ